MAIAAYREGGSFDPFLDSFFGGRGGRGSGPGRTPETEMVEAEHEIRVLMEMPGLRRENIEIELEDNVLTVRGEKTEERTEEEEGRYRIAERRYGTLARSFVLPRDTDPEGVRADFQDGVLTITVPRTEQARRRRIQIDGGAARQEGGTQKDEKGDG